MSSDSASADETPRNNLASLPTWQIDRTHTTASEPGQRHSVGVALQNWQVERQQTTLSEPGNRHSIAGVSLQPWERTDPSHRNQNSQSWLPERLRTTITGTPRDSRNPSLVSNESWKAREINSIAELSSFSGGPIRYFEFSIGPSDSQWFDLRTKFRPIWQNVKLRRFREKDSTLWTLGILAVIFWVMYPVFEINEEFSSSDVGIILQIVYVSICVIIVTIVYLLEVTQTDKSLLKLLLKRFEFWYVFISLCVNTSIVWEKIIIMGVPGLYNLGSVIILIGCGLWFLLWDANPHLFGRKHRRFKIFFTSVVLILAVFTHVQRMTQEDTTEVICFSDYCGSLAAIISNPSRVTLILFFSKYLFAIVRNPNQLLILKSTVAVGSDESNMGRR